MSKCLGCGIELQTDDKEKIGFIPLDKLKKRICERCFRISNYNDLKVVKIDLKEEVLEKINKGNNYVFFVVDLLNINKEVINTFKEIKVNKCLVISKIDYIPKSIKLERIKEWLKLEYKIDDRIIFLSAKYKKNIGSILRILEEEKKNMAYLVGFTNAGKSTLINTIINDKKITTSMLPNTTLDFMKIKLNDNYALIDTPGFVMKKNIRVEQEISLRKKLEIKGYLKPITLQLKKNSSVVIEDILRIENKSELCNLTIYMSNLLEIKKVYENNNCLKNLESFSFYIKKNEDIVVRELGFINVKSDVNLQIYIQDKDLIEKRKAFFGE